MPTHHPLAKKSFYKCIICVKKRRKIAPINHHKKFAVLNVHFLSKDFVTFNCELGRKSIRFYPQAPNFAKKEPYEI